MPAPPSLIPGSRRAAQLSRRGRVAAAAAGTVLLGTAGPSVHLAVGRPYAVAGFVGALVLTNAWSWATTRRRRTRPARLRAAMAVEIVLDLATVLGLLLVLRETPFGLHWPLLVLPVLEAALRLGSRAAVVVAALAAAGLAAVVAGTEVGTASVVFLAVLLFIVAVSAGQLADRLARQLALASAARADADDRAELLRVAANAGRAMATLDVDRVLETVIDGTSQLGFDAAGVRVRMEDGTWPMVHSWRVPLQDDDPNLRAEHGLMGAVRRTGQMLVIDDYSDWPEKLAEYRDEQAGTAIALPIRAGGDVVAILGTGTRERRRITAAEIECLELLAAHAGAAIDASRRFREARGLEARLVHQASHDRLTGLPNRSALLERLTSAMAGRGTPAVLVCDLDAFKTVNSSLGHQAGDRLLDAVAARLERTVGPASTVARFGGDEFAVLVPDGGADAGRAAADAILARLGRFEVEGNEVVVTASIGVAAAWPGATDAAALLRDAGLALYRAKQSGRGRCEVFDPTLRELAQERLALEVDLRKALSDGDLDVAFQPIVDLASGQVRSVEALARWSHPERGSVPPDVFIPLAEETGLIDTLGRMVLEQACTAARAWDDHTGGHGPRVSVNLSAVQVATPGLCDAVAHVLASSGLEADRLTLEITERLVMDDVPEVLEAVRGLAALGVRLSLDDFGRGWSSLSYLTRYPLAELKIDKAFVDGVAERPADRAVVRSLVVLAHDLGLDVVAEGIEDPRQLAELTGLGCDAGQGFLLHRPMTSDAVAALLRPGRALRVV